MKIRPTRTLNPLPFRDLEPRRFEDLVRALAYDFRPWKSLEAIGRSGGDEGIDIRGTEVVAVTGSDEQDGDEDTRVSQGDERLWIFQCKREQAIAPSRIPAIVEDSIPTGSPPPFGFVLAAACDLSKKARDALRREMVTRGVQEFLVWSRGELEDMLVQPKNDHVLFAFFNISLLPRRRSVATTIRNPIIVKKQLDRLLNSAQESSPERQVVLLRDPLDDRYPRSDSGRWLLCQYHHLLWPGELAVVVAEHLAWIREGLSKWDAIGEMNFGESYYRNMLPPSAWARGPREERPDFDRARAFWREYVPDEERGFLKVARSIQFDGIIAIDPLGDGYYPVPHILVEWDPKSGPFAPGGMNWLEHARIDFSRSGVKPMKANRARLFPRPIPMDLFPPPPDLDFKVPASELSPGTASSLAVTLDKFRARAAKMAEMRAQPQAPAQDNTNLVDFRKWRDDVGAPTLAALMEKLRDSGHDARMQVVSNPGQETIELHVRLNVGGSVVSPDFRPEGHVRFVGYAYRSIEVDSSPRPHRGSSVQEYGTTPRALTLADFDKTKVEMEVLQMLERISLT